MSNQTNAVNPHGPSRWKFFSDFLGWVFTGFGLLKKKENEEEIVVYSIGKGFLTWPLILIGHIGTLWMAHWIGSQGYWGWAYSIAFIYTIVMLLDDLNLWKVAFWSGFALLVYLIVRYPLNSLGIVPGLSNWLTNLNPLINSDAMSLISWVMTVIFFYSLVHSFANGRKTFTPNNIEEWHFGRGTEIQDRSGYRFQINYRDILETIVGLGAADLIVVDRANRVVKRYENVIFLFFRWHKLDRILHQRFALVDNVQGDAMDISVHDHHAPTDAQ